MFNRSTVFISFESGRPTGNGEPDRSLAVFFFSQLSRGSLRLACIIAGAMFRACLLRTERPTSPGYTFPRRVIRFYQYPQDHTK